MQRGVFQWIANKTGRASLGRLVAGQQNLTALADGYAISRQPVTNISGWGQGMFVSPRLPLGAKYIDLLSVP